MDVDGICLKYNILKADSEDPDQTRHYAICPIKGLGPGLYGIKEWVILSSFK